jgi:hypothetical protein
LVLRRLGGRGDFLVTLVGTWLPSPAARLGRFLLLFRLTGTDGRRKDSERNPFFGLFRRLRFIILRRPIGTEVATVAALKALAAAVPAALTTLVASLALAGFELALVVTRFGLGGQFLIALGLGLKFLIVAARATLRLLLLEA